MSLIRDSLKKVQEKEGQGGSSAEAPSAEVQGKPPRKYSPSIIILVLIGLALVGLTYFMLVRPGPIPIKKPQSPVMDSPLIAQAPAKPTSSRYPGESGRRPGHFSSGLPFTRAKRTPGNRIPFIRPPRGSPAQINGFSGAEPGWIGCKETTAGNSSGN